MKQKLSVFKTLFLVLLLTYSCQKTKNIELPLSQKDEYFVSKQLALKLAKQHSNYSGIEKIASISRQKRVKAKNPAKEIFNSLTVEANGKQATFYIINYKEGGFVVVSGDKRAEPILAYSSMGNLPVSKTSLPEGLLNWLEETNSYINYLREDSTKITKSLSDRWMMMENIDENKGIIGTLSWGESYPDCQYDGQPLPYEERIYHYPTTTWGQGVGYNDALNAMGCTTYSNGRPPAGCIATAVAIVMKFHQYPYSIPWANMPQNTGSTETANLMKDIGSNINMDYKCDVSGAQAKNIPKMLKTKYNYQSQNIKNFQYYEAFSEIAQYKRPIILTGGRKSGWWIFGKYTDGHAWVAEGTKAILEYYCTNYEGEIDWLEKQNRSGRYYFFMNWGWNGSYNGWYAAYNWNPESKTFNYDQEMILGIKPNN